MPLRPCVQDGQPVSFQTLMRLERINDSTYRSCTAAFEPGGDPLTKKRAYGGHVYAQAVWAAAQTVPSGFVISSVTGFFLLMGQSSLPFTYHIRTLRTGKSYAIRSVDVTQGSDSTSNDYPTSSIVFTSTCSFKTPDWNPLELQQPISLSRTYASVLEGKKPGDHPPAPGTEQPMFRNFNLPKPRSGVFPGLDTRKVDMKPFNTHKPPTERRQLMYYTAHGRLPPLGSEEEAEGKGIQANLHAAAHLYASDRNSLFIVPKFWEVIDNYTAMASLNHTVVFHGGAELLTLTPTPPNKTSQGLGPKWFIQESWTDRMSDGRGTHHSRILDLEGRHVATTLQDGMIRLGFHEEEELEGLQRRYGFREDRGLWSSGGGRERAKI